MRESTSLQMRIATINGLQLINVVLRHATCAFKDFISDSARDVKSHDCGTFRTSAFNSMTPSLRFYFGPSSTAHNAS